RDDTLLDLGGNPRPYRQRQVLARCALGLREGHRLRPGYTLQSRLQMRGRHVVGSVPDSRRGKRLGEARPFWAPDDVHVVDVASLVLGELAELAEPELGVAGGGFPSGAVPIVELAEKEAQGGGLELIEARVRTDIGERLLVARAVEPQ